MATNHQISIQKQVIEYFKDTPDLLFSQIVDSFVYHKPAANNKVSELITNFLKDNNIETEYANYLSDFVLENNKFFKRSSMSSVSIIETLMNAFSNAAYNRFRNNLCEKTERKTKKDTINKKNFNFIKKELLEVFERLNGNENYFYGEKEDEILVCKIKEMKYED